VPAADEEGGGADRVGLSRRDQHAAGQARPVRPVRRGGEQGRGEPGLAQGQDRLGGGVRPRPRRRGHRPGSPLSSDQWRTKARPRRHGGQGEDRPQGDGDLGARGHRRAPGRAEDPAGDQEHGRREHGRLAGVP
jgi:hypothetical protein